MGRGEACRERPSEDSSPGSWDIMTNGRGLIQGHRRKNIPRSIIATGEEVVKAHTGWDGLSL